AEQNITPQERQLLLAWIDNGMQKGKGRDELLDYTTSLDLPERKADFVWNMPEPLKLPADGFVPYAHYQIAGPLEKDIYLSGLEVSGYNRRSLHHAMLFACKKPLASYGDVFRKSNPLDYLYDAKEGEPLFIGSRLSPRFHFYRTDFGWRVPRGSYI